MNHIGEKIRIQRLTRNYSQEYMAFMLDISQAAYSNLERDETEMTIKRIYEIAEILEISPFELMPKPKFGVSIDHLFFWRTIRKFREVWLAGVRARKKEIKQFTGSYSDTL
ncbi:XRE family transcriptional regulator [Mucilaginibacter conchicola]|uniref:XRE family transcriptional regulator n=1 Tax=Mucilaginibacter conchicola TaxID=2303333 RepID=A0A372NQG0_9SPHI|nr:helix-turn-helix transcriptional regulator [Mucilaginibacter conchicola]RFZ91098.1 XRE family transcriptional regulator [Mucilaginibacter conchicola]